MNKNEKGFSAAEILVVIVIVGMVATIGWLVYDRQKNNTRTESPTQAKQQMPNDKTKSNESESDELAYFEIKELGVKFDLSKAPVGLYYVMGNDGKTAYFSLEEFKNTKCAADKTPQVALTRYKDEDFKIDGPSNALKGDAKKFGDYYYFSSGGQSACSDDADVSAKAAVLRDDVLKLLPEALIQIQ